MVYAAALKDESIQAVNSGPEPAERFDFVAETEQLLSPSHNVDRYMQHSFGGSVDNIHKLDPRGDVHMQRNLREIAIDSLQQCARSTEALAEGKTEKKKKEGRVRFNSGSFADQQRQRSRLLSDAIDEYVDNQTTDSEVATTVLFELFNELDAS